MEGTLERSQTLSLIARLYEAALHGNTNSLTILLQQDPLILDRCIVERSTQYYSQSPLHVAANMGHLELARMLLEVKPELAQVVDQMKKWTPLHMAVAKGHLQVIQALFNAKPQMSFACDHDGRTPIHIAVVNGQVETLTWFCQTQPLAVRERTASGETVFHLSVKYNQPTVLKLLIRIADLNDLLNSLDGNGNTALHQAVLAKHTEMLQILRKHSEIRENFMNKEKHNSSGGGFSQASQSTEAATTSLYEAIWKGEVETVLSLLRQDPLILDRCIDQSTCHFMQSPLHLAAKTGHLEMVQALLNLNPSMCLAHDEDGRTPIHVAASKGKVNVLEVLHNANCYAAREKTNNGESILHLCVKHGQFQALTFLVGLTSNDGDQLGKSEDSDGNTILHLAVISKQPEMVKYLLEHPTIEKNHKNKKGMTAVDIHREQSKKGHGDGNIEQSLCRARAKPAKDASDRQEDKKWLDDQRSALMVVASLIATMAFQVGINPPGGVSQASAENQIILNKNGLAEMVYAGTAIWSYFGSELYKYVQFSSALALISSLSVTLFLISGLPFKRHFLPLLRIILWIAVTSTGVTYMFSVLGLCFGFRDDKKLLKLIIIAVCVIFGWAIYLLIILLGTVVRFIFKRVGWKRREDITKFCKNILCCN